MSAEATNQLELDDIQSGVLRPRPTPYVATYIAFRIDDRKAGRELMQRASRVVTSAANPNSPLADTWVSVALTCKGLEALGVPRASLESFSASSFFSFFNHQGNPNGSYSLRRSIHRTEAEHVFTRR